MVVVGGWRIRGGGFERVSSEEREVDASSARDSVSLCYKGSPAGEDSRKVDVRQRDGIISANQQTTHPQPCFSFLATTAFPLPAFDVGTPPFSVTCWPTTASSLMSTFILSPSPVTPSSVTCTTLKPSLAAWRSISRTRSSRSVVIRNETGRSAGSQVGEEE